MNVSRALLARHHLAATRGLLLAGGKSLLKSIALLLALLSVAPPVLADVITVGSSGDFQDIQLAVDVAFDGDVILIRSGTYGGVTITDKALTLVADTGAAVNITRGVAVTGLSSSRNVVLAGLIVEPTNYFGGLPCPSPALTLSGNAGPVRVEDCIFIGSPSSSADWIVPEEGVIVTSCADVSFRSCTIRGGTGHGLHYLIWQWYAGPAGLSVQDSIVTLHESQISGGAGYTTNYFGGGGGGTPGGPGLSATDSTVFASGTSFAGALGGHADGCHAQLPGMPWAGGAGGHGVSLSGAATAFRHQMCTMTGAVGGLGSHANPAQGCPNAGIPGTDGLPINDPLGVAVAVPGTLHAMESQTPIRELTPFPVTLSGQPGDFTAILGSVVPDTSFQFDLQGQLLVAVPFLLMIMGTVPASGSLSQSLAFPDLGPGVESALLFTQPLFLGTDGSLTLGSPFTAIVLDGAF